MNMLICFFIILNVIGIEWDDTPDEAIFSRDEEVRFCDVDVVSSEDLDSETFESTYRFKKPVLLEFDGFEQWTDVEDWTRDSMIDLHGHVEVSVARSLEIVQTGGNAIFKTSLEDFIENHFRVQNKFGEPWYVFTRGIFTHDRDWYRKPDAFDEDVLREQDDITMVGAKRSGTSFHKHADAWNGVVFGAKRWFLYPPQKTPAGGVWPGFSQLDWFETLYPTLDDDRKPIECIQPSNTILYIPEGWYHGVLNAKDTVAISLQFQEARTFPETAYYRKKQRLPPQQAIQLVHKIVDHFPESAEAQHHLAWLYGQQNLERGLAGMDYSIELEPSFIQSFVASAELCLKHKSPKRAIKYITKAYKLNKKNSGTIRVYAQVAEANRNFDRAFKMWKRFVKYTPFERHKTYAQREVDRLRSMVSKSEL